MELSRCRKREPYCYNIKEYDNMVKTSSSTKALRYSLKNNDFGKKNQVLINLIL